MCSVLPNEVRVPLGPYEVSSVRKALEILSSFSPSKPTWTLSELSRVLAIPKSTAHNLLRTLQSFDFVRQNPEDKRFYLGPKVSELGWLFSQQTQLVSKAMPHMRRLAERTKETIKLGILSTSQVLVVATLESPHQLHTRGDVGRRWPLHSCSMGKAILAALPDEEVHNIVLERGLARFTERTITTESVLRRTLAQIRKKGYSVDREENEPGVRCAAASVTDTVRHALGALSMSGPSVRITERNIADHGIQVVETVHAISESLRTV